MRALMKGKAAEFFQRKQKVVQDPEVIMNQIQAKVLAKEIGIDQHEIIQFSGFFQQVSKIKLPKGYTRYPSTDKTQIYYLNEETGDEDTIHPNIDIIKVAFYKFLEDSNSVYTFNIKSKKLLPFVEEKMIKQCIGLSSKRREAQKTNLQRDQNGKVVISKLARLKPDLRALISSRSYMLKALVQKIFTRKQLWGKGKKANVYAAVLSSQRGLSKFNSHQLDDQEQMTEQQLQMYQKIYLESKQFYQQQFGQLKYVPQQLKMTKSFYRSTPQSVLRNLGILNIEKNRMQLYWLARLMECLPLPPGWSLKIGDSFDRFYYEPKKLFFDLHPSYIYVLQQMNDFKMQFQEMDIIHQNYYNNMKEMTFYDYFQRPYSVDLYAFVERNSQLPMTKKRALKKSQQLGRNDWMALQGIKNSQMKLEQYVIVQSILQYWSNLNCRQDNYSPAISPFGQVIWSSNINQRTINFCPHANLLKVIVEEKALQLPVLKNQDLKQVQESQKEWQQLLYKKLPNLRQNFLQHFIRNDPKPLSPTFTLPQKFQQNSFFDQIFVSPFNLQGDLKIQQSQTPIWLQKVHAKQSSDTYFSMINTKSSTLQTIRNKFADYALKMIKKHQPNREQDILRIISSIKSEKQLKKFILHINDIEARQQRKRLAAIGVVAQEQDSFGSSISQIDMDDQAQQQSSSEDDVIQIDVQKSQPSVQKDESESDKNDNNLEIQSQQTRRISERSQESDDSERSPQKYEGIIYQKDKSIQKLKDQQLNKKILQLRKQKLLKHKYSKSGIKDFINKVSNQLLSQSSISKQLKDRKRNILISRLNSEHAPFKVSPNKINHRNNFVQTPNELPDISQQFQPFQSQTSILGNEQISPFIREEQIKLIQKKLQQNQNNKNKVIQDDTRQTIELQPIKRIKPDISQDIRLRNIMKFNNPSQFLKTFNQQNKSKKRFQPIKNQKLRNKKQNLQDTASSSKLNPQNSSINSNLIKSKILEKINPKFDIMKQKLNERSEQFQQKQMFYNSSNLKKSQSVLSLSNNSLSPNKLDSRFNRVCLGNTATSLLSTQPLIKQTDLIVLQARKSLLSKGRGLQTHLSKKY